MKTLPVYPAAEMVPMLPESSPEFAAFVANIQANGQLEPVVLFKGMVLDGRHRDAAMVKLGRKTRTVAFDGKTDAEAFAYVCARSHRRTLTTGQKAFAAVSCKPQFQAQADARKSANGGDKKSDTAKSQSKARQESVKGDWASFAALAFGVGARTIYEADAIREADVNEFAKLGTGETTLAKAKRAMQCEAKRKRLDEKAAAVPNTGSADIITGDCIAHMKTMPRGKVRLVFADPPYNIDYYYGPGKKRDKMKPAEYLALTRAWVEESHGILTPDGAIWVVICDEWAAEFVMILKSAGFTMRRWCKWYEGFGTNCTDNFNRTTRHLLYFVKNPDQFVFDLDVFNRESWRQKHKDKRAARGGKVWDDLWDIPRLVDNSPERVVKGATQLPLALVTPIVKGCSEPGDIVFDPFTGTGTTAHACVLTGRQFIGTEQDKGFAATARTRVKAALAESFPAGRESLPRSISRGRRGE